MQTIATFHTDDTDADRFSFGTFLGEGQNIVVRRYREEDREFVLDLLAEHGIGGAGCRNPFIVQSDPLDLAAMYRGRSRLWVALSCDEIIGVVGMQVTAGIPQLRHLTVAQAWFGQRDVVVEHMRRKAVVGAYTQGLDGLRLAGSMDDTDEVTGPIVGSLGRTAAAGVIFS